MPGPDVSTAKKGVLYRVAYRLKESNSIGGPNRLHTLEEAQRIVDQFNARYGEEFEYFVEAVSLSSLSKQTLLELLTEEQYARKNHRPT